MFGAVSSFLQCGILQATLSVANLHVYEEAILWVMTPCILVDICKCFGGSFCVHLQNTRRHFDTLRINLKVKVRKAGFIQHCSSLYSRLCSRP
jgi:hypothetical protein